MLTRLLETYPPSAFVLAIVLAVALVVVGGPAAAGVVIGASAAWVGQRLDTYGTGR